MNRRDLLKVIGISGVGAVANAVTGKEAEAAPVATDNVIRDGAGNVIYNLPDSYVGPGSVTLIHADGTREHPGVFIGSGNPWAMRQPVDYTFSFDDFGDCDGDE